MDAITLMVESNLHYGQCIQGTAAKIISNTSKHTSITPFL